MGCTWKEERKQGKKREGTEIGKVAYEATKICELTIAATERAPSNRLPIDVDLKNVPDNFLSVLNTKKN
jgi:hypothetical protein